MTTHPIKLDWALFTSNVIGWAGDRKILQNGNPHTQALKLLSEFGELADGLAKNDQDEIMDAIGDCSVVCVILAKFQDVHLRTPLPVESSVVYSMSMICNYIAVMLKRTVHGDPDRSFAADAQDISRHLQYIATAQGLDYLDCCAHAWNEIKDRRGYLNELGVFVKESDVEAVHAG